MKGDAVAAVAAPESAVQADAGRGTAAPAAVPQQPGRPALRLVHPRRGVEWGRLARLSLEDVDATTITTNAHMVMYGDATERGQQRWAVESCFLFLFLFVLFVSHYYHLSCC